MVNYFFMFMMMIGVARNIEYINKKISLVTNWIKDKFFKEDINFADERIS